MIPEPGTPEFEAALAWHTGEDERHVARTPDGWNLALYRYLPKTARPHPFPVVMGHGLCGSHYIFDVHERYSMARALAARGFDVWLVDLRGRGESWPDPGPDEALQWTFDDFITHDIPTALAFACSHADAPEAFWLGTEMSGIALYALPIAATTQLLRGGVTLGSPAVTPPHGEVPGVTTEFPPRQGTRYPFSMVKDIGPILAAQQSPYIESSFRPANIDWVVAGRYFRYGVPDECTDIVDQFKDWMAGASMRTRDGSIVYSDRLGEFTLPVMLLAGAHDLQRPPEGVRATCDAIGSRDKTFVLAGIADGFSVDYGHDDLLTGLQSPAEIYPLIADWLTARS